ncbi:hypothetical protein NE237_024085 [Protea cynaroides]|uniref:Uncharacterized protein n=1 Tax=Protea cynaroides TaxID=273540 RepID=A0A9Q0HCQ4_9MAGN|nr:hypothetical protein NE237_024085 [Protea cynaroides]
MDSVKTILSSSLRKQVFLDIFYLLFSSDLEKRKFIKCQEDRKEARRRQWIIFISVLIQKILLLIAKPMAWVCSKSKEWLNLLSCNGGFTKLIAGNVVMHPNQSLTTFTSYIGIVDRRLNLSKSIKPGDSLYYTALSMMASKLSYENKTFLQNVVTNHWKIMSTPPHCMICTIESKAALPRITNGVFQ